MQVVVRVIQGPAMGRKIWLREGQSAEVGRLDNLDFPLADDDRLADVHFSLACKGKHCRLVDVSNGRGVLINGAKATDAYLQNGDKIVAGQTTFEVTITGASAGAPPPAAPVAAAENKRETAEELNAKDPILLEAERGYKKGLQALEEQGEKIYESPPALTMYAQMSAGLADILRMRGKKEEGDQYEKVAEELYARDDVQEFLAGNWKPKES